jgi:glycosyltransferase involved in cell wall biosynthesis
MEKKICLVISSVHSGGIEADVLRYLEFLDTRKHITVLVRKDKREGDFLTRFEESGVNLKFMSLGYVNPIKFIKLYNYFKNSKFDTVCDLNANFAGLSMLAAYIVDTDKRVTFYKQGRDLYKSNFIKNSINNIYNKLVFKYSTHILANSYAALDYFFPLRKPKDKRFDVIYNGINSDAFNIPESKIDIRKSKQLPIHKFIVGHVGRLTDAKNHDTILKVCQKITKENSDIYFVLCGRDTDLLMPKINALGISDSVSLLGFQTDIPHVLKSFDLFFFPSVTEGQPNALLEALLSGLPFVASNIEPIKECIPQEQHCFLAMPTDVDALANIILELKNKNKNINTEALKNYAKDKFNAEKNLNAFNNKLINE